MSKSQKPQSSSSPAVASQGGSETKIKCPGCNKKFKTRESLLQHVKSKSTKCDATVRDVEGAVPAEEEKAERQLELAPLESVSAILKIPSDESDMKMNVRKLQVSGKVEVKEAEEDAAPAQRAIVFVIDVSGSMSGSRLDNVRKAVMPFIEEMCENPDIFVYLEVFESRAEFQRISNDPKEAKAQMNRMLRSRGGTDFLNASRTLVQIGNTILKDHPGCEMMLIVCSDGEVGKENARSAHKHWKQFVEGPYSTAFGSVPFVESIGISSSHDADVLDGFICSDEMGNYTCVTNTEGIAEVFQRAAEEAAVRKGYMIQIATEADIVTSLYSDEVQHTILRRVPEEEFEIGLWIKTPEDGEMTITVNDQEVEVAKVPITDEVEAQKEAIDFHHQFLRDMIQLLRAETDEAKMKEVAQKIKEKLEENEAIHTSLLEAPASQTKRMEELAEVLNKCGEDDSERRAQVLRAFKDLRVLWAAHRESKNEFEQTRAQLKRLVEEILTGKARMQEIRQHVLDLHFKKKHAKRIERLVLDEEELQKRQAMYDALDKLTAEEVKDLSDEPGSGCFLSTLTLRELALDGEALWVCGFVDRTGGLALSNPEMVRIRYISPYLVCQSYFDMALELSPSGFTDGNRELVNARLFPIYGNWPHLRVTRPYLQEVMAHTLAGRVDVRVPDNSLLPAVFGHFISASPPTEKNVSVLVERMRPTFIQLAKYMNCKPFAGPHAKLPDLKAEPIKYFELCQERIRRYMEVRECRTTAMLSNLRLLFSDLLLTRNDFSGVIGNAEFWLGIVSQRLREMALRLIPQDTTDPEKYKQARMVQENLAQAIRIMVHGVTGQQGETSEEAEESKSGKPRVNVNIDKLLFEFQPGKNKKVQFTDMFRIEEELAPIDEKTESAWDVSSATNEQLAMCAQVLARVQLHDLIQAHRFFRLLQEEGVDKKKKFEECIQALREEKPLRSRYYSRFIQELGLKHSHNLVRAVCSLALVTYTNKDYLAACKPRRFRKGKRTKGKHKAEEEDKPKELDEEELKEPKKKEPKVPPRPGLVTLLFKDPDAVLTELHTKVVRKSRAKPKRLERRVKPKPKRPIDLARRKPKQTALSFDVTDMKSDHYQKNKDMSKKPSLVIATVGLNNTGKTSCIGRLLYDLRALSDARLAQIFGEDLKDDSALDFSKILLQRRKQGTNDQDCSTAHLDCGDNHVLIVDQGHHRNMKNNMKAYQAADSALMFVPAVPELLAESLTNERNVDFVGGIKSLASIVHAIGVTRAVVCVTMMDHPSVGFQEKFFVDVREAMVAALKRRGFNINQVAFIPLSARSGDNVVGPAENMPWYQGFTLFRSKDVRFEGRSLWDAICMMDKVHQISQQRQRLNKLPLQLQILGVSGEKAKGKSTRFQARVMQGTITSASQQTLVFQPAGCTAQVLFLQKARQKVKQAQTGDLIRFLTPKIKDLKDRIVTVGDVAEPKRSFREMAKSQEQVVMRCMQIQCDVVVVSHLRIRKGHKITLYFGSGDRVYATVAALLQKGVGAKKELKPAFGDSSDGPIRLWFHLQKPCALAIFKNSPRLGRFVGIHGDIALVGKIVRIKSD